MRNYALCVLLLTVCALHVRADEGTEETGVTCMDGIQNGNETGIDCGSGKEGCPDCVYDDEPEVIEDSSDWDPTGSDDMTRSDENTTGAIVGTILGVCLGSIVFGWFLPKICKTKKQSAEGCCATSLLAIAVVFLLIGSASDAWCTWDVDIDGAGHFHFVANAFGICENHQSGTCVYIDQQCDVHDEDGDAVPVGFPVPIIPPTNRLPGKCDTLRTVQAFVILTCMTAIFTWIISYYTGAKPGLKNVIVFFSFATAGLGLLTMSVWAHYRDSDMGIFEAYSDRGQSSEWYYDWSFFLFITGWVVSAMAMLVACFIQPRVEYTQTPTNKQ